MPSGSPYASSSQDSPHLSTREIRDYSDFLNIKSEWNALARDQHRPSLFLRHEWFDAAWQWLQTDRSLRIVCCNDGDNLIAIAPLCSRMNRLRGFGYREISLIEIPDSQECDILAAEGDVATAVSVLMNHLETARDWDKAVLPKLEPDSGLARHAADECKRQKLPFIEFTATENMEVQLEGTWEDYYRGRSRRLKKGNNNVRNKILAQDSEASVNCTSNGQIEAASVQRLLDDVKAVSASSWKKDTGLTLDQAGPGGFIDRITEHAEANDWLSIWTLTVNDQVIATEYHLVYEGVVSALRADFDPSQSAISPGTYLNWQIINRLFDSDNRTYRMGGGDNPYKVRWANHTTPLREMHIYNRTLRGVCLWLYEGRLKPMVRKIVAAFSRENK